MCLAIPMQITHINGFDARCSAKGAGRDVSLFMLQDEPVGVGDWVLINAGYALQKISAEEARESWELFDQILAGDAVSA
ncbi:MAG: HypC/HybG/HupF family hydrogenase formation chaperone [Candidatus Competibacteraceae bacterium]|uniref:Nickel-iron hydrogenase, accessory protein n=1 Tax=Candidatus Contendobacter odensis Run_B_J11 TaxID=1400861 RepID=A0A7U7GAA8_9GAMM|nr:HypC/HybG/HupF family hydrogenase formation chaperone [Candidatus Contendobacter odensis]MBK8534835.1 HypC/HybG/HupF family hydrogenase formation chaperone [Candidatus Competibacteraceae bacterium]MBK8753517.1 HypC/HybG/HupF family hydrogenase formation chaperone [Candidatus Competibacteraceae bacterium]CDH44466.1 Nickel-iron hydrogenase, accessory protein [Candidatus Contendobacter odensis Run_B_J11]